MSRQKKEKPQKKPKVKKVKQRDTSQGDDHAEESRMVMLLSIVAGLGAVVLLFFFFTSDIPSKIASAKMQPKEVVVVPDESESDVVHDDNTTLNVQLELGELGLFVETVEDKDGNVTFVPRLPDITIEKDELISFLKNVDGDGYDTIITFFDMATKFPDTELDRETIIKVLTDMSDDDFNQMIKTPIVNADTADDTDESAYDGHITKDITPELHEQILLEEAIREAERLYPGQIDASKRISLIEEMNAIDFLYYVVENGDRLGELSDSFNVPMGQLLEMNGIKNADMIRRGEIILFPTDVEQSK